jgi:hypothetical protein
MPAGAGGWRVWLELEQTIHGAGLQTTGFRVWVFNSVKAYQEGLGAVVFIKDLSRTHTWARWATLGSKVSVDINPDQGIAILFPNGRMQVLADRWSGLCVV